MVKDADSNQEHSMGMTDEPNKTATESIDSDTTNTGGSSIIKWVIITAILLIALGVAAWFFLL